MRTAVRTILGDVDPTSIGIFLAHEHLIVDGGVAGDSDEDLRLDDVEAAVAELGKAAAAGVSAVVDATPAGAGRNPRKLAEVSRRTGVHIVAATGLHLPHHYAERHWRHEYDVPDLVELFLADMVLGIDESDYHDSSIRRTPHRAGIIKVAGGMGSLSPEERRIFVAAAAAASSTGCSVTVHLEQGLEGLDRIQVLADAGLDPRRVVLAHVDKIPDLGYHRALIEAGAYLEYDGAPRHPVDGHPTIELIGALASEGRAGSLLLGMDLGRRAYWTAYGGRPGLAFLLGPFVEGLRAHGVPGEVITEMLTDNPRAVFTVDARSASTSPQP